jgi:hypothetical protein
MTGMSENACINTKNRSHTITPDVGIVALSTFGRPIPTPTSDRMDKASLRYNAFHTTAPGLTHAPYHAPMEWVAKFKGSQVG